MNQQDNCEANNRESLIEDLTVNEALSAEVKGGPVTTLPQSGLKCGLIQKFSGGDIEGEVTTLP